MSYLRGVTAIRMQWWVSHCAVLTLKMFFHQVPLWREIAVYFDASTVLCSMVTVHLDCLLGLLDATFVVQGATSISSADYYGREEGGSSSGPGGMSTDFDANELVNKLSYQARQDAQQLKSMATTAGRKLSNLASNFMKDLQGGY